MSFIFAKWPLSKRCIFIIRVFISSTAYLFRQRQMLKLAKQKLHTLFIPSALSSLCNDDWNLGRPKTNSYLCLIYSSHPLHFLDLKSKLVLSLKTVCYQSFPFLTEPLLFPFLSIHSFRRRRSQHEGVIMSSLSWSRRAHSLSHW